MEMRTIIFIILVVAIYIMCLIRNFVKITEDSYFDGVISTILWSLLIAAGTAIQAMIPCGILYLIFM